MGMTGVTVLKARLQWLMTELTYLSNRLLSSARCSALSKPFSQLSTACAGALPQALTILCKRHCLDIRPKGRTNAPYMVQEP